MEIRKKYIKVFIDLNNNPSGLLAFSFHTRYDLSASEIVEFVNVYKKKGYITCNDEYRIKVTKEGRDAILKIESERKLTHSYTKGSEYFEQKSIQNRISINAPYIPSVEFLNKNQKKE